MKTARMEEIEGLSRPFFEFFRGYGVFWWRVEIQSRRQDGSRGAPLGGRFGSKHPWHADRAAGAAAALEERVVGAGRRGGGLDLACAESAGPQALRRLVLVDDLDGCAIDELLHWWLGPVVTLETSSSNYQAIIVLDDARAADDHLSITRAMAARFGGDPGAVASGQLHRFPGSANHKFECIDAGGPFVCKLVSALRAAGDVCAQRQQQEQIFSEASTAVPHAPTLIKTVISTRPNSARARDQSNSGQALSWCMRELRRGATKEQILKGLSTRWLSHHDPVDWPERTLRKATLFLSQTRSQHVL